MQHDTRLCGVAAADGIHAAYRARGPAGTQVHRHRHIPGVWFELSNAVTQSSNHAVSLDHKGRGQGACRLHAAIGSVCLATQLKPVLQPMVHRPADKTNLPACLAMQLKSAVPADRGHNFLCALQGAVVLLCCTSYLISFLHFEDVIKGEWTACLISCRVTMLQAFVRMAEQGN